MTGNNFKCIFFFLSLAFTIQVTAQSKAKIKVACVGASITYGALIQDREHNSFPAQLQKLLGSDYQVFNLGVNGCTMLKNGNQPYWKTKEYQSALSLQPDIVIIDLGGNDAKLINRKYYSEFESDYHDMIRSFAALPSHPRIVSLLAFVSFVKDTTGIWDPVIVKEINPRIRQVAFEDNIELIDMHSVLVDKPQLVPDAIHPNAEGAALTAKKIYSVLGAERDRSFNIFFSITNPAISSFYGFQCADFVFECRNAKLVKPKFAAKGHPWVWRARFWGHEPQTDIALLELGFHVVYCDVAELFGNAESIRLWNHYYSFLTKAGLSKKGVLEGMSRGAVYVFNWAAANPKKVAAVYVDNPVLDLKSWPGGLGKAVKSPVEFEQFKKDYNLNSEEDVNKFAGSPLDKIKQIVKGRYPILIICADADEAVPPEENTLLFEQKIKAAGGQITVIHKPGFKHHPHSLPNPEKIVDFILKGGNR